MARSSSGKSFSTVGSQGATELGVACADSGRKMAASRFSAEMIDV